MEKSTPIKALLVASNKHFQAQLNSILGDVAERLLLEYAGNLEEIKKRVQSQDAIDIILFAS